MARSVCHCSKCGGFVSMTPTKIDDDGTAYWVCSKCGADASDDAIDAQTPDW